MKQTVYVSLFILIGFFSCKKRDTANYSYWRVNQDTFASNNVSADVGKDISYLASYGNQQNSFHLKLYAGWSGLPTNSPLLLSCTHDPFHVCVSIYYKGNVYGVTDPTKYYMTATTHDGKVRYTLPPTWFIATIARDSVLVSGEFNEP